MADRRPPPLEPSGGPDPVFPRKGQNGAEKTLSISYTLDTAFLAEWLRVGLRRWQRESLQKG